MDENECDYYNKQFYEGNLADLNSLFLCLCSVVVSQHQQWQLPLAVVVVKQKERVLSKPEPIFVLLPNYLK